MGSGSKLPQIAFEIATDSVGIIDLNGRKSIRHNWGKCVEVGQNVFLAVASGPAAIDLPMAESRERFFFLLSE